MLLAVCYGLGSTATAVNSDMTKGIINRFKVMDVSRGAVLTGHVVATRADQPGRHRGPDRGGFRARVQPVGERRWTGSACSASSCCSGSAAGWFTVALGLVAKSPETAGLAAVPLVMLPFFSSAIVPGRQDGAGRCGSSRSTSPSRRSSRPCAGCSTAHRRGGDAIAAVAWCVGIALVGYVWARSTFKKRA